MTFLISTSHHRDYTSIQLSPQTPETLKCPLFQRFVATPSQPQVRHLEVHVVAMSPAQVVPRRRSRRRLFFVRIDGSAPGPRKGLTSPSTMSQATSCTFSRTARRQFRGLNGRPSQPVWPSALFKSSLPRNLAMKTQKFILLDELSRES